MRVLVLYHRPTNTNILETASKDYDECYMRSIAFICNHRKSKTSNLKASNLEALDKDSVGALENFYMRWIIIEDPVYIHSLKKIYKMPEWS